MTLPKRKRSNAEDQLQASICSYLRKALPAGSLFHSIPNGAFLAGKDATARGQQMAKLKWTGLLPGAADLFVMWNGRGIYLEVKTVSGRLQDTQRAFCDSVMAAGGFYAVVRSIDETEAVLRNVGVPMRGSVQ